MPAEACDPANHASQKDSENPPQASANQIRDTSGAANAHHASDQVPPFDGRIVQLLVVTPKDEWTVTGPTEASVHHQGSTLIHECPDFSMTGAVGRLHQYLAGREQVRTHRRPRNRDPESPTSSVLPEDRCSGVGLGRGRGLLRH